MRAGIVTAVVTAIVLAGLLAGCGAPASRSASGPAPASSAGTSSPPPGSAAAATAGGGSVTPGPPEVNPAGDIPDNQVYVAYTLPSGRFSVRVPEGWARSESGGAVTFSDHLNAVRLETVPASAAPTVASARSAEAPAIQAQGAHVTIGTVTTVRRTAGQAVLITYQADSPPNAVTGRSVRLAVERYEFWRAATEAVLTLSGPVGADNVDPWRTVTDAFRWQ
jgi:hypothetical protein